MATHKRVTKTRKSFFAKLSLLLAIILTFPLSAWAATVTTDSQGTLTLPYDYSGSITTSDCSNPARGAGYYGDIYKVSSDTEIKMYLSGGADMFIQVLESDRKTIYTQDDDSGAGLDAYLDAYVTTGQYIVATTYSPTSGINYVFSTSASLTQVTTCPQVITFNPSSSMTYGDTLNVTASTNMSLPVTLTSETSSICDIESSSAPNFTVRAKLPGTCRIKATQAGSGSVEAATAVVKEITVNKRVLTLTGLSGTTKNYDATTSATLSGTPTLSNIYSSDDVALSGTVSATYNSADAGSRTIALSGLSLTGTTADRYQLNATISGIINKVGQTVNWAPTLGTENYDITDLRPSYSGKTFTAATSTPEVGLTGGTLSYSVVNAGTTGCTVNASRQLSYTGVGSCVVRATAASTTNYNAATKDLTFTISKLNQTVEWATGAEGSTYDLDDLRPSMTGKSLDGINLPKATTNAIGGTVSYSIAAGDAGSANCSITSGKLYFTGAGSCWVTATGSHQDYNAAAARFEFTISKVNQSVSWSPNQILLPSHSGSSFNEATTTGDGEMEYSVTNAGTTGCTVESATRKLEFTGQGNCKVQAKAKMSTDYNEASKEITFMISKLNQVLQWSPTTSLAITPTEQDFAPATTSGDGAIVYSVVSDGGTQCTVSGATLKFWAAGTCKIRATATGTVDFNEAAMDIDFVIPKAAQAVTWNPSNTTLSVADAKAKPDATPVASGSGEITYSVASYVASECTVDAVTGEISFAKAGTCVVRAIAAETPLTTSGYHEIEFTINPIGQTVLWKPTNSKTDTSKSTLRPSSLAKSTGSGAISYSVISASKSKCSVNSKDATLSFSNAGTCTVRATAAETARETSAFVDVTFTIEEFVPEVQTVTEVPSAKEPPTVIKPISFIIDPGTVLTSSTGPTKVVKLDENGLPQLVPLQSLAFEGGRPIEVTLNPSADMSGIVMQGDGFEMLLSASTIEGIAQTLNSDGSLELQNGNYAMFNGRGFAPNTKIIVWMFSKPTLLGEVTTDENGNFSGQLKVPASLPAGQHTVQLNGISKDGATRSVAVGVEVVDANETSTQKDSVTSTSSSISSSAAIASAVAATFLFAGLILVISIFRRQKSPGS